MILKSLSRYENTGLLLVRSALGVFFLAKGYPILASGPSAWERTGAFANGWGLGLAPIILGCALGLFGVLGGAGLLLGFLTVPAVGLAMIALGAEIALRWSGLLETAPLLVLEAVLLGVILTGPGRYALDEKIEWKG